jgi:glycosyltransferase involved in cell wall biosynthesis
LLQYIKRSDLVWIHNLKVAEACRIYRWPKSVLDIDDLPSRMYFSSFKARRALFRRLMDLRMSIIWRRREKRLLDRFSTLAVCSRQDKHYLGNGNCICVIPNGFELPATTPKRRLMLPPRLGFIGTFAWEPNIAGVEWFTKQVWPLIKREHPEVRLRVVGSGSDKGITDAGADIDRLGWVDDPTEEIASWTAMIVPIRMGGGTRIKIAEGFARMCPVVSTRLGAFGYEITHGREILLADSPAEFAGACCKLLRDPQLRESLARNAHEKYLQHWTWDAVRGSVHQAVETCLKLSGNPTLGLS